MLRYLTRRTLWAIATMLLLVTIAFFAVNLLLPYDYAVVAGQRPRAIEAITAQLGLDRPLWVRWGDYMFDLIRGDLGRSFDDVSFFVPEVPPDAKVVSVIADVLPVTIAIFAVGGLVAYLLGERMGRFAAWHRKRRLRAATTTASVLLYTAFPPWLAFLLTYFLTERLFQVRSAFGMGPMAYGTIPDGAPFVLLALGLIGAITATALARRWARRHHHRIVGVLAAPLSLAAFVGVLLGLGKWAVAIDTLLSPSTVMATAALVLIAFGEIMLVMRAGVTAEMSEDYVFTARAKGLREREIRDRHVAPNAVLPAMSRFMTSVPYLLAGLIIIEREVKLRGLSSLLFDAIEVADVPVILGIIIVVGLIGLVLRIALDAIQAIIDPRLRLGGGEP